MEMRKTTVEKVKERSSTRWMARNEARIANRHIIYALAGKSGMLMI